MAPLIFVLLLGLSFSAWAETPTRLMLAVPDSSGRISLGVFNPAGKLVRALSEAQELESFQIGLNGIILTWDGLDDQGKRVSPGKYEVRGWFIPSGAAVEGEAFHFNSWEDADGIPPVSNVLAAIPTDGEEFYLVGIDALENRAAIWKADAKAVLTGRRFLPEGAGFLAGDGQTAVLQTAEGLGLFALSGDEKLEPLAGSAALAALSASRLALVVAGGSELLLRDRDKLSSELSRVLLPFSPNLLIAGERGFLVSDGTRVALVEGDKVTEIPLGDPVTLESLAPGAGDSFWMSGTLNANPPLPVVRNFSFSGELLRELKLDPSDRGNLIFSSPKATGFYLLSHHNGTSNFRGLRPLAAALQVAGQPSPGPEETRISDWEEFLVRKIELGAGFGFLDGQPAPSALASDVIKIALAEDPLSSRQMTLPVRLAFDASGAWLEAEEGLNILPIWHATRISRVAVAPGKSPGSIQILIGQPAFAAGFIATGLLNISPLEGGEVEVLP